MEKSAVRKIGRVSRLGKISKRKCRGRSEDRNHLCLLAEFEKENPADGRNGCRARDSRTDRRICVTAYPSLVVWTAVRTEGGV
jgi:hypothetical protein